MSRAHHDGDQGRLEVDGVGGAYGMTRADGPTQHHLHSGIRTPNGNDYGKELLRQHYRTSPHGR